MLEDMNYSCTDLYLKIYETKKKELVGNRRPGKKKCEEIEKQARKWAIGKTFEQICAHNPEVDPKQIWDNIYLAHIKAKSGIDDGDLIDKIVSSHQSWIKTSGHAFEDIIKEKGTAAMAPYNIKIVLQRDLTAMLGMNGLDNEPRDIDWLKTLKDGTFDLYAIIDKAGKNFCFGCIQSKTSVRERVKGDREPSIQAMSSYFWSTAFILNGDFLELPKFTQMVNGGTEKFPVNGWHGMYVFSHIDENDRIYQTNLAFCNFREHAVKAAEMWLHQRQWLNCDWKPDL